MKSWGEGYLASILSLQEVKIQLCTRLLIALALRSCINAICFDQLVSLFAPELADKVQKREEEKRDLVVERG